MIYRFQFLKPDRWGVSGFDVKSDIRNRLSARLFSTVRRHCQRQLMSASGEFSETVRNYYITGSRGLGQFFEDFKIPVRDHKLLQYAMKHAGYAAVHVIRTTHRSEYGIRALLGESKSSLQQELNANLNEVLCPLDEDMLLQAWAESPFLDFHLVYDDSSYYVDVEVVFTSELIYPGTEVISRR